MVFYGLAGPKAVVSHGRPSRQVQEGFGSRFLKVDGLNPYMSKIDDLGPSKTRRKVREDLAGVSERWFYCISSSFLRLSYCSYLTFNKNEFYFKL